MSVFYLTKPLFFGEEKENPDSAQLQVGEEFQTTVFNSEGAECSSSAPEAPRAAFDGDAVHASDDTLLGGAARRGRATRRGDLRPGRRQRPHQAFIQ